MFTALSVLIRGMHAFSTADDKPFDEGVAQLVFDIQCWIKLSANAAAQAAGQLGSENQQKMEPRVWANLSGNFRLGDVYSLLWLWRALVPAWRKQRSEDKSAELRIAAQLAAKALACLCHALVHSFSSACVRGLPQECPHDADKQESAGGITEAIQS